MLDVSPLCPTAEAAGGGSPFAYAVRSPVASPCSSGGGTGDETGVAFDVAAPWWTAGADGGAAPVVLAASAPVRFGVAPPV